MTTWDLQLCPETAQPFKDGQPPDIVRLVDAAVAVAEMGRSIDNGGRESGYEGVVAAVRKLFEACDQITPDKIAVRKWAGDLRLNDPGGLFSEIQDRVTDLVACDKKVAVAEKWDTEDIDLVVPQSESYPTLTEDEPIREILRTERDVTADKLEVLVRDALALAYRVYTAAVKSRNQ